MSELKFDRERFDRGEMPTRTRDGRKVLKVLDSRLDVERPIVAWIEDRPEGPLSFDREGRFNSQHGSLTSKGDLVHEPKKRWVLIALYRNGPHQKTVHTLCSDSNELSFERYVKEFTERGDLIQVITVEVPA